MDLAQVQKLLERTKGARKGDCGHALIIGGSIDYAGAVVLSGLAALRSACDLVTVAAPEKVAWVMNTYSPDIITTKVKGGTFNIKNAKDMIKLAERYDAVLVGPGMSRRSDNFNQQFVKKSPALKVIDADALKSLSFKDIKNSVCTPHWTELEMMLVNSHKDFLLPKLRESNAKQKAEILQGNLRYFLQNNNVLLVKGPTDIILSRQKVAFNRTGNPGMSKAGTGDVLSGICVGLLAKTKDLFKSAVASAYLNGLLGDELAKKKKGFTFLASDMLDDLKQIKKRKK